MKKIFLSAIGISVALGVFCGMYVSTQQPVGAAYQFRYAPIIFDVGGLDRTNQPMNVDPEDMILLDNFYLEHDRSSSLRLGKIVKVPSVATSLTMPVTGWHRGLGQFWYDTANPSRSFMFAGVCTTAYTDNTVVIKHSTNDVWSQLTTTAEVDISTGSDYHLFYEQANNYFLGLNTYYVCDGNTFFNKWFYETISFEVMSEMKDVGATVLDLTGAVTLTNGSKVVTGSGCNFLAEANKGAWIRGGPAGSWYEVDSTTGDNALTLRAEFDDTTYTGSTTAEYAAISEFAPSFVEYWKNRLWMYGFFAPPSGYTHDTVVCSAVLSSVTPAAFEDHTGSDTGYVQVQGTGYRGTGIVGLDDYLICFKDTSYTVYRYNANVLPPLEVVNQFEWGCPVPRTIKKVSNGVIYYTGAEVRWTNGFKDICLSDKIANRLKYHNTSGNLDYYYSAAAADNTFPTAAFDEYHGYYHLYFPSTTTTQFTYDVNKGEWIGQDNTHHVGSVIEYYEGGAASQPTITYLTNLSTTEWTEFDLYGCATATGEMQSGGRWFEDRKRKKMIHWVEFWLHVNEGISIAPNEVTFAFDFYTDGDLAIPSPKLVTIEESATDANNMTYHRFNVNATCYNFRWRLRDLVYGGTQASGNTGVIGGNICYDYLEGR